MNWFSRLSSFFQLSAATGVNILDACGKMPARQILAFISNADIIWASASVFSRRPLYLNNLSIYIISRNAQFSLEQRKATPHDCITHWVWNTAKWAVRACIQNRTYCMRGIKTAEGLPASNGLHEKNFKRSIMNFNMNSQQSCAD